MLSKYLFLDIDGVLNCTCHYEEKSYAERKEEEGHYLANLSEPRVKLLDNILKETGALLVITSTWRLGIKKESLQELLYAKGLSLPITGYTPRLSWSKGTVSVPRGCEISEWLMFNAPNVEEHLVTYAILDDDSDMLLDQAENYFMVDGYTGVTPNLAYRVIRHLNRWDPCKLLSF